MSCLYNRISILYKHSPHYIIKKQVSPCLEISYIASASCGFTLPINRTVGLLSVPRPSDFAPSFPHSFRRLYAWRYKTQTVLQDILRHFFWKILQWSNFTYMLALVLLCCSKNYPHIVSCRNRKSVSVRTLQLFGLCSGNSDTCLSV